MATTVIVQAGAHSQPQIIGTVKGHRNWSSSLFDCFSDVKSCLMAMCCMPCAICDISSRIGDCACMPFCVPGALLTARTRIRTLGGIEVLPVIFDLRQPRTCVQALRPYHERGSICNDCMVMSFCGQCAVCQMTRELDNMGL